MTINSGLPSAVWQALSDYMYKGDIQLEPRIYHDFVTLVKQLEMKEAQEELDRLTTQLRRPQRKRLRPFNQQFVYNLPTNKKKRLDEEDEQRENTAAATRVPSSRRK